MFKIKFKLTHGAVIPERANLFDSGLDLRAKGYSIIKHNTVLEPIWFDLVKNEYEKKVILYHNTRILIKTGIQIALPTPIEKNNYYEAFEAQIRCRSGLALKEGIMVVNGIGTIDNGYRNDIGVILYNSSIYDYTIYENDKIAQLVFSTVIIPKSDMFETVDSFDDITDRNMNGFGSSGKT